MMSLCSQIILNLFDTIVWVIYGEPEISTHCNLRKHVNRQNIKLRKQLHQSDNAMHLENTLQIQEIIAKAENKSCFQMTVKGGEHGSDTLVVAMVCGTLSY